MLKTASPGTEVVGTAQREAAMKRMTIGAVLALALICCSQQRASAWVKSNFNVGLNWTLEGGGNCFIWGLWRSSPYPGPGPYPWPGLANHGWGYPWPGYARATGARTPLLARRNAPAAAPNTVPAAPIPPSAQPPAISTAPTARQVGYTKTQPQTYSYQGRSPGVVGVGITPGFQAPSYWYGD
jgi:hypothetical protein